MSSFRTVMLLSMLSCVLGSGCYRRAPTYLTDIVGQRTDETGTVIERIVSESKWGGTTYLITPEGDYTAGFFVWQKYFVESNSKRHELRALRETHSTKVVKAWHSFYPVLNKTCWIAIRSESFDGPARISWLGLVNTNAIANEVRISIAADESEIPEMVPRPGCFCVANEDLADMHLYDGNTRLLYRTFIGGLKYHVYHILENRTEDITEEQAAELKKTAGGIHPVENLTWKLNQSSLTGTVSAVASPR